MAAPIIRWAGGKTRLLLEIRRRMPPAYGRYFEPFAGGAALFFALSADPAFAGAVICDVNEDLITMYRAVRDDVESVIRLLEIHAAEHQWAPAQHYATVRTAWNSPALWAPTQRAAGFLYLNATNFNGLWRVNSKGEYNVPLGKQAKPRILDQERLRAAAHALKRADIRAGSYAVAVADAAAGDFLYFDPPYDGTFTDYAAGGFGDDDQRQLADCARELVRRGAKVMLSNSDTAFVRALYHDFHIETVKCGRAINSDGKKRGAVDEVVIMGGYVPATVGVIEEKSIATKASPAVAG